MFKFDPYDPAIDADPFPAYKTLRDEHPCFWSDEARMWVLSRYEDIMRALNDWQTYSSAKGNLMDELPNRAGATLGSSDPPRHDRMRNLIQHAFSKRNLDHLVEPIRASANRALDAALAKPSFDFVEDFSSAVTIDSLFALLSLPSGDERIVRDKAVLMVQTDPKTRQKGPEHIAAYEWMQKYAAGIIAERERNPGDDLLSQFCLAEIDGERLSEREVLLTTTTLIMAGIESLGGFMVMLGYNLATQPDARRRLVAEPGRIADAIEESLRFNTSAQRFRRNLQKDVTLHGQTMKAGDFVCLAYGSGNRDDRQFANPDVYDIERKPRGHLGFGGGVHACLGTSIARLGVKITFEELLRRLPDFAIVEKDLKWMPSSTFRSPLRLEVAAA